MSSVKCTILNKLYKSKWIINSACIQGVPPPPKKKMTPNFSIAYIKIYVIDHANIVPNFSKIISKYLCRISVDLFNIV